MREYVRAHTPQCLAGVLATPIPAFEDRGMDSVAFRLSRAGGHDVGEIHGHDLRDYNPSYTGPTEFISPLAIQWPGSPAVVIFDSDVHGFHGEDGGSAKLRGKGPAATYSCPGCKGKLFRVTVQFDYDDACHDLWNEEPQVMIQDYFRNLIVMGGMRRLRTVDAGTGYGPVS